MTINDLNDFQNNQHTFSRLQLLLLLNGWPITRFDVLLESFKSIDESGWTKEKTIQMLRAKLTDKAFSITLTIEKKKSTWLCINQRTSPRPFPRRKNAEIYLEKLDKAKRNLWKKIMDYTHSLQEFWKRAYPICSIKESFAIIFKQKFIQWLDYSLQQKVKYKEYR